MTLDLAQFFAENISKEMRISHFYCHLYCGKPSKLKDSKKQKILAEMGDKWLEDADMLVILQGDRLNEDVDAKKKLFGILDRSLGTVSNNLSKSDMKEFKDDEDNIDFMVLKVTFK